MGYLVRTGANPACLGQLIGPRPREALGGGRQCSGGLWGLASHDPCEVPEGDSHRESVIFPWREAGA